MLCLNLYHKHTLKFRQRVQCHHSVHFLKTFHKHTHTKKFSSTHIPHTIIRYILYEPFNQNLIQILHYCKVLCWDYNFIFFPCTYYSPNACPVPTMCTHYPAPRMVCSTIWSQHGLCHVLSRKKK